MNAFYPKFGINTTHMRDAMSGSIPKMGQNIVEALAAYVSARMKDDPSINTAEKMSRASKVSKSTVDRVQRGTTAVSIDKLPGLASALKMTTWELLKAAEVGSHSSHLQGSTDFVSPIGAFSDPGYERLLRKLSSAFNAGLLGAQHVELLEGAIDSQLAKQSDLPAHAPEHRAAAAALKVAGEQGDAEAFKRAQAGLGLSAVKPAPRKRA